MVIWSSRRCIVTSSWSSLATARVEGTRSRLSILVCRITLVSGTSS